MVTSITAQNNNSRAQVKVLQSISGHICEHQCASTARRDDPLATPSAERSTNCWQVCRRNSFQQTIHLNLIYAFGTVWSPEPRSRRSLKGRPSDRLKPPSTCTGGVLRWRCVISPAHTITFPHSSPVNRLSQYPDPGHRRTLTPAYLIPRLHCHLLAQLACRVLPAPHRHYPLW